MHEQDADAPLERPLSKTVRALAATLVSQPCHHVRQAGLLAHELAGVLRGQRDPAALQEDARFAHPGWRGPWRRRLLSAWHACGEQSSAWAQGLQLGSTDRARLQLLLRHLKEASAPSNSPFCPRFGETLKDTRGRSLEQGLRYLMQDLALSRPLPAQSPDAALLVGRDMACTPGDVVHREPLFELLQYRPTTAQVRARPLLIIPPPLNRFYLLDMTPASSLVRHALDQGLQVFLISWRNPNPSHCDWGLDAYTSAADSALGVVGRIRGESSATLMGVCAGGLIGLLLQGRLQARSQGQRVAAASYLVTPIAGRLDGDPLLLASPEIRRALRSRVWQQGCLGARQLAAGFAWLQPRQLIWTPLIRRYAMGEQSSAHPVRIWNQDSTRLPAQLVDDLLRLLEEDWLGPSGCRLAGEHLDLSAVSSPSWHLGAVTDHIVPWANSFPGNRLGGERSFVLSSGGHIQSLLSHPKFSRAWYQTAPRCASDSQDWTRHATRQAGSWWPVWSAWVSEHSGELIPAPTIPGSLDYPALYPAPGRYVHQS